jgi:hypothetical protein
MNSGIAKDGTAKNDIPEVNLWPCIFSTWLNRDYINPFGNASDMGKAIKPKGFGNKSKSDNDNMINTIMEYIKYIPLYA